MVLTFRFEYYENVVTKHHLKKIDWRQAAQWAFYNKLNSADTTIASVKQIDEDTVEIVKRVDQNKNMFFNLGFDQRGLYERVIINRKDNSVAVDRLDANWWQPKPFLGQRDLFYVETKDKEAILNDSATSSNNRLAFVRHNYWVPKLMKFDLQLWSNFSASSYKRAFASQQV